MSSVVVIQYLLVYSVFLLRTVIRKTRGKRKKKNDLDISSATSPIRKSCFFGIIVTFLFLLMFVLCIVQRRNTLHLHTKQKKRLNTIVDGTGFECFARLACNQNGANDLQKT
ncbi:hypothetical protein ANTPLA_LOCUS642 [Anthophora plagiata]